MLCRARRYTTYPFINLQVGDDTHPDPRQIELLYESDCRSVATEIRNHDVAVEQVFQRLLDFAGVCDIPLSPHVGQPGVDIHPSQNASRVQPELAHLLVGHAFACSTPAEFGCQFFGRVDFQAPRPHRHHPTLSQPLDGTARHSDHTSATGRRRPMNCFQPRRGRRYGFRPISVATGFSASATNMICSSRSTPSSSAPL